jgi:NHLM bacteriocin system ABC transporter ATP-binding protein
MPNCADYITTHGESREVAANHPMPLDDPASVWIVSKGSVDVFAVSAEEGIQRGARIHLCRVETGELLCGCEPGSANAPTLLAVGFPGSEVVRLDQTQVKELLGDEATAAEFAALIDKWIQELTSAISKRRLPKNAGMLKIGENLKYPAGAPVSPTNRVSWVLDADSDIRFLGQMNVADTAPVAAFPIAASGWITLNGAGTLSSVETPQLLGDDRFWSGLQRFHELVLQGAADNARRSVAADVQRMEEKARAEERLTESALSQLAAAATPEEETLVAVGDDPLLAACRMVGDRLGMPVTAPRNYGEKTWTDPVGVIARASAIRARRVKLTPNWWRQDNGPLLGYRVDSKQPVALIPASPGSYEIVEPVTHSRTTVDAGTAPNIQAFGYTFYRSFKPDPLTLWDVIRFGLHGTRRDWILLLIMGLAGGLLGLLVPLATGWIIGSIIPKGDYRQLSLIVVALVVTSAVAVLFEFIQGLAMLRIETRMDAAVESGIWDRVLNLPASFFRQYTSGDLAMRTMGISDIRQAFTQTAASSLITFMSSLVFFGLLFYYDVRLAFVAIILFVLIVTATIVGVYYQLPHERAKHDHRGRVWGIVLQLVTGISRLRVAAAEKRALAYWAQNYSQQTKSQMRAQMVSNNLESVMAALPVVAPLVIFASVMLLVPQDKPMTVAAFLAFNVAFLEIIMAGITMSATISTALDVVPLFERSRAILTTRPEYDRGKRDPGDLTGDIEISHVSFRYNKDSAVVLDDVSLHIRPGEFVAFVGPSGAGKSTILRLLLGFETANTGSIYYDREDLSGLDALAVRHQIGVVLQDSKLVPGDILSNIIGSAPLTQEDAWEAARLSGLDGDIKQMPMGLYTFLSDGESTLSGGQRQRLFIARAIVKKPPILFFDEATSALDNVTQAKVAQSLDNLKATRVVVAHRLSTIINADRIFVINRGKVVQQGTYKELMAEPGLFTDLVKRQLL